MNPTKIAVMVSGKSTGTNFAAIVKATQSGKLRGKVVALVSTNEFHGAVARARDANIKTLVLPPEQFASSQERDQAIADALYESGVSIVALAGYMRLVTPGFLDAFPHRVFNVHPALLPSFGGKGMYGSKVHQAVLDYGCKVSGATVHIVSQDYDMGPIVGQTTVAVSSDDTAETLAHKVQTIEHELFPRCLDLAARNLLVVEGRKVRVLEE